MKAVVFTEGREFELQDRPMPVAGPGGALLKVELCGICGTDLHAPVLEGVFAAPVVLGHEFTARIEELGDGAEGFEPGERVVVNPIALACGHCAACLAGKPNACVTGLTSDGCGLGKDGGMAEYVALDVRHLHRVPDAMGASVGAWVEPLAVAVRGVRRVRVALGESVAILGAGPIGQLALQVARAAGAGETLVVESSSLRRRTAADCGATGTLAPDELDRVDRLYDVVIDCTGAPPAFDSALELVAHSGRVLVIGTHTGPVTMPTPLTPHVKEATITFTMCYRNREEFLTALELLATGKVDVNPLTTRIEPLQAHREAFAEMANPERAIKILLAPSPVSWQG